MEDTKIQWHAAFVSAMDALFVGLMSGTDLYRENISVIRHFKSF